MVNALLLLLGFVLLIYGANLFVDGSSAVAKRLNVPNIVIGLTVVAFGTSAPEFVVNVFSALDKNSEFVLGNVIGSNIFNVLVILGISSIIHPLSVKTSTTWVEVPLSLLATLTVLIVASDVFLDSINLNTITRSEGIILLAFFVIFLGYNLQLARSGKADEQIFTKNYSMPKSILVILAGLALLVAGGRLIVNSAVNIATILGISERVIAITIISAGTSLPELATSLMAVRRRNVDMAIGNVVGSNIFNIFFILGTSAVITPVTVAPASQTDILVCLVSTLLMFAFIFTGKGRRLERWEGILFMGMFVAYIIFLIAGG